MAAAALTSLPSALRSGVAKVRGQFSWKVEVAEDEDGQLLSYYRCPIWTAFLSRVGKAARSQRVGWLLTDYVALENEEEVEQTLEAAGWEGSWSIEGLENGNRGEAPGTQHTGSSHAPGVLTRTLFVGQEAVVSARKRWISLKLTAEYAR